MTTNISTAVVLVVVVPSSVIFFCIITSLLLFFIMITMNIINSKVLFTIKTLILSHAIHGLLYSLFYSKTVVNTATSWDILLLLTSEKDAQTSTWYGKNMALDRLPAMPLAM